MKGRKLSKQALHNLFEEVGSTLFTFNDVKSQYGVDQDFLYNILFIRSERKELKELGVLNSYINSYRYLCKTSGTTTTPDRLLAYNRKRYNGNKSNKKGVKNVEHDDTVQDSYDKRVYGEAIKDNGKIIEYKFRILVRDKEPFEGTLSLTEMEKIYLGYSSRGYNLSAKKVFEDFPKYDLVQFKKILRAFNITKDCFPFPPHIECVLTEEEKANRLCNLSTLRAEKRAIKEEGKYKDSYITNLLQEINTLKEERKNFSSYLSSIDYKSLTSRKFIPDKPIRNFNNSLVLYLSDWHIGAYISKYSAFSHRYDLQEICDRIDKMLNPFISMEFDHIYLIGLGDMIDGYSNETTRGGHYLPQIGDGNKEIFKWFMSAMTYLFNGIRDNIYYNYLDYYVVGESNHGGDFEWVCQKAFENYAINNYNNLVCNISDSSYNTFEVYGEKFVITHGKDNLQMYKNLPLTINKDPNAEIRILQILDSLDYKYAHFIKGDLHQSATTHSYRFRYRSVGCMIGSTEWSGANFGDTDPYCDYDIVTSNGTILEGRIKLN